jgi:ribosome-associated protein
MTIQKFSRRSQFWICPVPAEQLPSSASPEDEILPGVWIAPSAVRFQYARSRGPGGQNVNKVNTKAELWVRLTAIHGLSEAAMIRLRNLAGKRLTTQGEIHIASDTERSQEANRLATLVRLRAMLAAAKFEPKARRKTKPSRSSQRKRVEGKRRRSEIKSSRRSTSDD